MAAAPGGGNYEVKYPATVDYANGPIQGSSDALKYMSAQVASCPQQVYVLIGYSEGVSVQTIPLFASLNRHPLPQYLT